MWTKKLIAKQSHNCSSYNFGMSLKTCLRICAIIGMISSILYIIAGSSLISHISQNEKATFSVVGKNYSEKTRHIYYKRNANFFIGIASVLIIINIIQLTSDLLLLRLALKDSKSKSLWIFFLLDILLWIFTLICFITIFSGGGLFLLLVFLLGTAIRAYIVFILHEFMGEESKIHDKKICSVEPFSQSPAPSARQISFNNPITGNGKSKFQNNEVVPFNKNDEKEESFLTKNTDMEENKKDNGAATIIIPTKILNRNVFIVDMQNSTSEMTQQPTLSLPGACPSNSEYFKT